MTQNSSHFCQWRNGILVVASCQSIGATAVGNVDAILGFCQAGYNDFDGKMDELGYWNRTLNSTEISDLYNNGIGIFYIDDFVAPNVTINTPTAQNYSTTTITFNVTAVDETWMSACIYSLNAGVTNFTMANASTSPNDWTNTNSSMAYGSHTVVFYCDDTSNNINDSEQVTFTINTPPTIPVQLLPENASGYAMESTITFVWENSTDADSNTITYDLEIYNKSDMSAENLVHSNTSISEGVSNTSIAIKLSDFSSVDDDYYWRVRAKDSLNNGTWSSNRTFQYANWTITFNLTDSYTGEQISTKGHKKHFTIFCDNGFKDIGKNPYTATDVFTPGTWTCTFSNLVNYYDKEKIFTADSDKTINVPMSASKSLTAEEHTWLEAIHECIANKNCDLYNLLLEMNSTIGNIWEHTAPTDELVVLSETITNKIVNSTNNLTIDYSVYIPVKAGYNLGAYLPVRIGYFFLDINNKTCYNQGERPEGVSDPYCQPLIIETIGPMGGSVNFTVELQPALVSEDNYTIKRTIDIDPNNVWINYGQDVIGTFIVTESLTGHGASVKNTGEVMPKTKLSKITGAVIGAGQHILSGWQLVVTIAIIGLVLVVFIVSRTILKIKDSNTIKNQIRFIF